MGRTSVEKVSSQMVNEVANRCDHGVILDYDFYPSSFLFYFAIYYQLLYWFLLICSLL